MLVCDKHRTGDPRRARYEVSVKDLEKEESLFSLKKELCVECGEKLAAIIIAFIERLKPEAFFDEIREDVLEQILEILARKTKEMEKEKEVQVG